MRAFVTGGSGFLGWHLVEKLLDSGYERVFVYDRKPEPAWWTACGSYIQGNVLNLSELTAAMGEARPDVVFHLAALADVRDSLRQSTQQIQQNLMATHHVLEAMRFAGCKQIAFSSSAVVYGNHTGLITENHSAVAQTSVYGAMKQASEALIQAYCAGYHWRADIFRFVSILGEGYKHGNLADFVAKLTADPSTIHVLGSRSQVKYYVYAGDAVDAMCRVTADQHSGVELWNVADSSSPCVIDDNVTIVCQEMGIDPIRTYDAESWVGDLPSLVLDTTKLRALGWAPSLFPYQAMQRTVRSLMAQGQPV